MNVVVVMTGDEEDSGEPWAQRAALATAGETADLAIVSRMGRPIAAGGDGPSRHDRMGSPRD
jgi:hypothetical protein